MLAPLFSPDGTTLMWRGFNGDVIKIRHCTHLIALIYIAIENINATKNVVERLKDSHVNFGRHLFDDVDSYLVYATLGCYRWWLSCYFIRRF